MEILVVWLLLCLVPAYFASQKGNSGPVAFLVSLLLSPLVGLIVAVLQSPPAKPAAAQLPPAPQSPIGIADELAKLAQLRDTGAITQEEFDRQRAILLPTVPTAAVVSWGPTAQADPGMLCGKCGRPLSPVWKGRCHHCGALYAEHSPVARA